MPGGRGGGTSVNCCWVCVAGISEPLPHCSLFHGHLSHFCANVHFVALTQSISAYILSTPFKLGHPEYKQTN